MEEKERREIEAGKEEEVKREILEKSEVSLWLDSYDDIFSDFDPRPYSERALSDDFLREAKKVVKEKKGSLELKLLIPEQERNVEKERVIRRRLAEYFRKNFLALQAEVRRIRRNGVILALIGSVLLMAATYIAYHKFSHFAFYFLLVLFEPAGWFSVWFGLDEIFYTTKERKPELEFFRRMCKVDINFVSY